MTRPAHTYRRRAIAVGAASACIALWATSPAAAEEVADASCPGPATATDYQAGTSRVGQTFTAVNTGQLTRAQLAVDRGFGDGDWILSINAVDEAGTPTNTVLASTTVPDASVLSGMGAFAGEFAAPAAVTAGEQYAVVVTRPTAAEFGVANTGANPCPGAAFYSPDQSSDFIDFGGPPPNPFDFVFAVFVEPLPPSKAARTVSFDTNKSKVKKGRKVGASGDLNAPGAEASCEANQTVEILRDGLKRGAPQPVATLTTDAQGGFSMKLKMRKTSLLSARTPETAGCLSATSDDEKVRVKKPKAAKEA